MYSTLAKMIEKKIVRLENKMKEVVFDTDDNTTYIQTMYGLYDAKSEDDSWTWSYILDDICANTRGTVNSVYRPDGGSMPWDSY